MTKSKHTKAQKPTSKLRQQTMEIPGDEKQYPDSSTAATSTTDSSTHSTRTVASAVLDSLDPTKFSKDTAMHPAFQGKNGRNTADETTTLPSSLQRKQHGYSSPSPTIFCNDNDRAALFLKRIQQNQEKLLEYDPNNLDMNFNNFTVISNALEGIAARFMCLQQTFQSKNINATVDIGYHYTKRSNLHMIQSHGLLTLSERQSRQLPELCNGRSFGNGIYTSHNPYSYHGFAGGDIGIFCARLQGTKRNYEDDTSTAGNREATTIIGRAGGSDEVCVLQYSGQCIPLVMFSTSLVSLNEDRVGNIMVHKYHCSLQRVMDEMFNQNRQTSIPRLLPSNVQKRQKSMQALPPPTAVFHYTAPETLMCSALTECLRPADETRDDCSICWSPMVESSVVKLNTCGHVFHEHCIRTSLNTMYSCPVCRACVGVPRGCSPSGRMTVTLELNVHCLGYVGTGTIVVTYDMPAGVQKSYHDVPGVPYDAIQRTAYLPNTPEGRNLLKRLKFAFCNGLVFRIGVSMTTGQSNRITWASIHHKTSLYCGAHGYPDPYYFGNVNAELDQLHVPQADDLC